MPNIKEALGRAKERLKPEGIAISGTIAGASLLAIPAFQSVLTFAIHEAATAVPTDVLKYAAVGLLAITNIGSVAMEAKTLKEKGYSSSPVTSTAHLAIPRPVIISTIGHGIKFIHAYAANPVTLASTAALLGGDNGRLFTENAAAVGIAVGIWNIGFNRLILKDRILPVVEKIKKIKIKR